MKISNELRCTIRAAAKAQPKLSRWDARQKRREEALERFLKNNPHTAKALTNLRRQRMKVLNRANKLQSAFDHLGIRPDDLGFFISDEDKFLEAGGVIEEPKEVWVAEKVIAELAAADAAEGVKILKRIGIRWE